MTVSLRSLAAAQDAPWLVTVFGAEQAQAPLRRVRFGCECDPRASRSTPTRRTSPMTDDTELYGTAGEEPRDSFDHQFLLLMRTAREQGLHLWRDDVAFLLDDDGDNTVFKTDLAGVDGLEAIGAWLVANERDA
jgi:hypothetical protein